MNYFYNFEDFNKNGPRNTLLSTSTNTSRIKEHKYVEFV